ncbi:MAG: hypothetical protein IJ899_16475 [Blautia sp.]|nr:hypothetical protein [Blautia sp.]
MRRANTLTNDYMRNPVHFADAINYNVFGGRKVLRPEDLTPLDSREDVVIEDASGKIVLTAERFRDLIKYAPVMVADCVKSVFIILGIENQTDVSCFAPPTAMLYDSLDYWRQRTHIWNKHSANGENRKLSQGEWLSKFHKQDRLVPVVTVFVHWGSDPWTGSRKLSEMFADGYPKEIMQKIQDYTVNLITPSEIHDFSMFSTELGATMQVVAAERDSARIQEILNDQSDRLLHMSNSAINIINEVTSWNIPITPGKEGTNVVKGVEQYIEEQYGIVLRKKDREIEEKSKELEDKDRELEDKDRELEDKDKKLEDKDRELEDKDKKLEDKDRELEDKDKRLENKEREIENKEKEIEYLRKRLEESGEAV